MRPGRSLFFLLFVAVTAIASCAQENAPPGLYQTAAIVKAPTADASAAPPKGSRACTQAHAESIPTRLVAMSASAMSASAVQPILVSDLYTQFIAVCGSCHGPDVQGMGGFQITGEGNFTQLMTNAVIAHVTHAVCPNPADPTSAFDPMPPCDSPNGETYANRSTTTDPVYLFSQQVLAWLAAGSPASFTPSVADAGASASAGDGGTVSPFALSPQDGNAMTNIGNCVPGTGLMGLQESAAKALDAKFAAATSVPTGTAAQVIGLPEHLSETDLVSLDSATLAQYGVISYAPAYWLWADNAYKTRYVRVPRGQSIQFDKATQQFTIPPNTRFYKTFMKQIIDTDGSIRYRKMETRLIVSRPDTNNPDGTAASQNALFGTYQWRDDESDADLVETPLRSGEPFSDTMLLYNTNEPLAADILKGQPAEPDLALVQGGAARHYAIPGSARCMECHMGSPSQSFVLGFTPLQINRFPTGTHGVIEEAGPDELTQLQRFIDAGIITGIDSPSDILPLEQSQGTRAPRNYNELTAQGYMLGNCAHCHNPRGYPSVTNPVLTCVFDLLPSQIGGIFQFPLERYSPRIGRGPSGTTLIPYITPSLVDLPRVDPASGAQAADVFVVPGSASTLYSVIYAPWRSIIYRNVDAAFAYVDDLALFPHMPMNTAGYDPRAKDIFSDWMVSIPAIRKRPDLVEYAYQTSSNIADNVPPNSVPDTSPQPYVEVLPGDPNYEAAAFAATQRLQILHSGTNPAVPLSSPSVTYSRYTDDGITDDILDPEVEENPVCTPVPVADPLIPYPFPDHPHWVVTDLSDPPPPWTPRQPNWPDVLVHDNVPPLGTACTSPTALVSAHSDEEVAVQLLPGVQVELERDYLTTPRPFGLWQQQAGCDFSSQQTVQDFAGSQQPHWMQVVNPPADAPVYQQTPGEAVFKMICINCHGPRGDATGRLAQNLATMTGGSALVADFRDGLFGPVGSTELQSNRHGQYSTSALPTDVGTNPAWLADWVAPAGLDCTTSPAPTGCITDDDRASRYMAWMGLGGTSVNIPVEILQIVAVTKVLDQQRVLSSSSLSANMLSQAKALCLSLLGPGILEEGRGTPNFIPGLGHGYLDAEVSDLNQHLIAVNGDADLWLSLCARDNPHPVHILKLAPGSLSFALEDIDDTGGDLNIDTGAFNAMVAAASYPPATPVGNDRGGVDPSLCVDAATCCPGNASNCTLCSLPGQTNCQVPNEWPWCIDPTTVTTQTQSTWVQSNGYPLCPASLSTIANSCNTAPNAACETTALANQWAIRGAINAGLAVFTYVESIENTTPPPDYDECTELPGSATAPAITCGTSP